MALVPALSRYAGQLGLNDQPSSRKVHVQPIPRVGGIAISLAVCLSILVWVPLHPTMIGLVFGGLWIALFGAIDDVFDLHYMAKIVGQLPPIAVAIYSGITVEHLPFFGLDPAPVWICTIVTAVFFLGITNAINLFDGLDGLAGGCVLVTLAVLAYLALLVDGAAVSLPSIAMIGAVLAFLNFNTHPARIFLGDAGSQFLGFCVAALTIVLIGQVHTAMNPATPLLLLGLPILDTAWVFCLRIMQGRSPFKADRQHLHHQLLDSGLSHAQVVSFVYFFQVIFVGSAVMLRYASDATVVAAFLMESALFLATVGLLRKRAKNRQPSDPVPSESLTAAIDRRINAHPSFLKRLNQGDRNRCRVLSLDWSRNWDISRRCALCSSRRRGDNGLRFHISGDLDKAIHPNRVLQRESARGIQLCRPLCFLPGRNVDPEHLFCASRRCTFHWHPIRWAGPVPGYPSRSPCRIDRLESCRGSR